jgi:hypothetical protein
MKNIKKKIVLFLFVLTMFISSCSSPANNDSDQKKPADANGNQADDAINTTTEEITPDLPEQNFNGNEIHFLVRGGEDYFWDAMDIYTEAETGDVLNDTIYKRNRLIEAKYNTKITETAIGVGQAYNKVSSIVKSGEAIYHAVVANALDSVSMSTNNLLFDLNKVPHINLNTPWWDNAINKDLSILNKQFCSVNATNIMSYEATWSAMFNKKMLADRGYNPANIYDMVKAGTWTIPKYFELTKDYTVDLNNDGKLDDQDQYGTCGHYSMVDGFNLGGGLRFIEKDKDDGLVFKNFDERMSKLFEMVTDICNNRAAFNTHDTSMNRTGNNEYYFNLFSENRALFFTETIIIVRLLREMTEDFGVVPMPKYDETQEKYVSMVQQWATTITSVPNNCPDLEMTGIIIEEMAYQSKRMVLPVYFEKAINGKYLRDEESIEMVDYIMESRVMDYGVIGNYGNLAGELQINICKGSADFSSLYEKNKEKITGEIEKIMDNLGSIEK